VPASSLLGTATIRKTRETRLPKVLGYYAGKIFAAFQTNKFSWRFSQRFPRPSQGPEQSR